MENHIHLVAVPDEPHSLAVALRRPMAATRFTSTRAGTAPAIFGRTASTRALLYGDGKPSDAKHHTPSPFLEGFHERFDSLPIGGGVTEEDVAHGVVTEVIFPWPRSMFDRFSLGTAPTRTNVLTPLRALADSGGLQDDCPRRPRWVLGARRGDAGALLCVGGEQESALVRGDTATTRTTG